ncbi:hypothetical protein ANN_06011 [Periplaneta americana]|uniref:Reverse transcriptase domain-containing protein n=1 Tax=Periplaneta americana TaxID=6978 RepID=A0ABQ8TCF9_PERAM|nr:hypothetical protein ANN_06011 [Periplaneta americana]
MLGENTQTVRENTEILLEASKAIGLEVNPEKTKYMIMSRDGNIVRNGNINIGDLSFEEVEKFKYLGATVTNINDTREEIKRRINMGNACYYSVEKLFSSSLLSKNLKVRIYKTVILPVLLYGCETWTLTLREEHRLRVFENKVLRKIFGAKRDEVTGEWRKLHNTELHALYSSPDIIRNLKSRRLRWAGHVARMGESRNAYRVIVGRPEGKRPLGRPRRRWEDNIKMDLREVGYDDRDWLNLAQDRDRWRAYVRAAMNLRVMSRNQFYGSNEGGEKYGDWTQKLRWLFNDAVSTTRLFSVDGIGYSEMVFGEMRPRIRHRLPDIRLAVGENLGKKHEQREENWDLMSVIQMYAFDKTFYGEASSDSPKVKKKIVSNFRIVKMLHPLNALHAVPVPTVMTRQRNLLPDETGLLFLYYRYGFVYLCVYQGQITVEKQSEAISMSTAKEWLSKKMPRKGRRFFPKKKETSDISTNLQDSAASTTLQESFTSSRNSIQIKQKVFYNSKRDEVNKDLTGVTEMDQSASNVSREKISNTIDLTYQNPNNKELFATDPSDARIIIPGIPDFKLKPPQRALDTASQYNEPYNNYDTQVRMQAQHQNACMHPSHQLFKGPSVLPPNRTPCIQYPEHVQNKQQIQFPGAFPIPQSPAHFPLDQFGRPQIPLQYNSNHIAQYNPQPQFNGGANYDQKNWQGEWFMQISHKDLTELQASTHQLQNQLKFLELKIQSIMQMNTPSLALPNDIRPVLDRVMPISQQQNSNIDRKNKYAPHIPAPNSKRHTGHDYHSSLNKKNQNRFTIEQEPQSNQNQRQSYGTQYAAGKPIQVDSKATQDPLFTFDFDSISNEDSKSPTLKDIIINLGSPFLQQEYGQKQS